jgi:hypothetical protein
VPALGVRAGHAGDRAVPPLPSRAQLGCSCFALGVSDEVGEDGVADASFQTAHCLFVGLALLQLALVIGAAVAVAVGHLGDSGHVDGMVELAVAPPGETENLVPA